MMKKREEEFRWSFCKAQLQRDVNRDTAHSVGKHNGSSDPSLFLILCLFSRTAVLPAPVGNRPDVCRGLAHMHRHVAIAQELAHVYTERKHTATVICVSEKRKLEKLIQTQRTRHMDCP